jgi:hypothetical protein
MNVLPVAAWTRCRELLKTIPYGKALPTATYIQRVAKVCQEGLLGDLLSTATLNATEPPTLFATGPRLTPEPNKHGASFHIDAEMRRSPTRVNAWPPPVTAATMLRADWSVENLPFAQKTEVFKQLERDTV